MKSEIDMGRVLIALALMMAVTVCFVAVVTSDNEPSPASRDLKKSQDALKQSELRLSYMCGYRHAQVAMMNAAPEIFRKETLGPELGTACEKYRVEISK